VKEGWHWLLDRTPAKDEKMVDEEAIAYGTLRDRSFAQSPLK
jgi:hypothetical protein